MIALLASFMISTNATARELVENCRTMIPANVELSGRIILRNRKGIPQAEHDYVLSRSNSVARLTIDGNPVEPPASQPRNPATLQPCNLFGTDVTWSDIALDYLWWDDFRLMLSARGRRCTGRFARSCS